MPRNGTGTYTLPAGNPVATGTTISSTVQNNTMSDVAVALTNSLSKDGQTTPSANLTMGGFKLTNLGNATVATDAVNVTTAQNGAYLSLVSVSGADTITAAASPTLTAYANGQRFSFIAAGANTSTSVTLNIDGLGAKSITKLGTQSLAIGDISSGQKILLEYDGTRFQMLNQASGSLINSQVFTTAGSYTYTPTAGTRVVVVEVQGAGGGSGYTNSTAAGQVAITGGGASGSYAKSRLTTGFSGASVVVGAGGTAGTALSGNGGNGGQSSFGTVVAAGGNGSAAGVAQAPPIFQGGGGAPSAPSVGNIVKAAGKAGGYGVGLSTSAVVGGDGAPSFFGGGGVGNTAGTGVAATTYGAGGGGSAIGSVGAGADGAAGSHGIVIVWEYS